MKKQLYHFAWYHSKGPHIPVYAVRASNLAEAKAKLADVLCVNSKAVDRALAGLDRRIEELQ